jgi:putative ABC transport system permease protein
MRPRAFLARSTSITAIATFALGIGATTTLFGFVDALLLRPLPFSEPDRLVRIELLRGGTRSVLSALEVRDINEQSTLFDGVASFRGSQYIVTGDGTPENVRAAMASHNLFQVLGVRPYLGATWPKSYDGTRVFAVAISYDLWRNRFGADPNIVGKPVTLDSYPYTVLGVLPPGFDFPGNVGIFRRVPGQDLESRTIRTAGAVARLKHGVTLAQAQRELDAISARLAQIYPETNRDTRFVASPLRDFWMGEARPYLGALSAAVGCLLLVACANIGALLLAGAAARERDMAVRAALGARPRDIVRRALAEVMVLGLVGGAIGLGLAYSASTMLDAMIRAERPAWMNVAIDLRVAAFTFFTALVAGIAAGIIPALRASAVAPIDALRAGGRGVGGARIGTLRRLVTAQLALAVVLVASAGLLGRSLAMMRGMPLGFDADRLLTFKIDPPWSNYDRIELTAPYYRRVLEEIRNVPGVVDAATDDAPPIIGLGPHDGPHQNVPVVEGATVAERRAMPPVNLHMVSPGYFELLRIPLRRGRAIHEQDLDPWAPVAVVSGQLAAKLWPGRDPIGRRLRLGDLDANYNLRQAATDTIARWVTVVGVAGDVREQVTTGEGADLYVSNRQFYTPESYVLVRCRGGNPMRQLRAVREAVWRVDPGIALFDIHAMDDRIADSIWQHRLAGVLSAAFGALALVLATVGLYGVMTFATVQRRGEIGVRAALGADGRGITWLVVRDASRMAAWGLAIGVAAALAAAQFGAKLLFGISALDPVAFVGAVAVLGLATLAAAFLPARRASKVDPLEVLRGG